MNKYEAYVKGFTHTGKLLGIPIWMHFDPPGSRNAPILIAKLWGLDWLIPYYTSLFLYITNSNRILILVGLKIIDLISAELQDDEENYTEQEPPHAGNP